MRAVICIPWSGDDPVREANYQSMRGWLPALEVFEGDSDPALPFNRSQARNRAAAAAGDWDVAAFVDACCLMAPRDLMASIVTAGLSGKLILPTARDHYELVDGHPVDEPYPFTPGVAVVIPRPVWDVVGGYDERFTGWSYEDAAILNAAATLADVGIGAYRSFHLSHPRDPLKGGEDLRDRYFAARFNPEAMRALLSEPGGPL